MNKLEYIKISVNNLLLADNYRAKSYVKNFNLHVDDLISACSSILGNNFDEDKTFHFNDSVYWKCEAIILEELDDVNDDLLESELDNLEDMLYELLKKQIKRVYRDSDIQLINRMLDMTINNILLYLRFDSFSNSMSLSNPWAESTKILFDNNLVYTFSSDIGMLKDFGLKVNKKESELISRNLIGVIGKGNQDRFGTGYFRDLTYLRNLLYDLLEAKNHNSSNPIKADAIYHEVRNLGITESEFTNNNIKYWLIDILKKNNRVGSNNEGYFIIKSAEDLISSYNRHFESFQGYFNTLERHKQLAVKFGLSEEDLNKHNKIY